MGIRMRELHRRYRQNRNRLPTERNIARGDMQPNEADLQAIPSVDVDCRRETPLK
jgi:hypothetical protein